MVAITLNGEPFSLEPGQSVLGLIETLDLADRRVAVLHNGDVIRREEYSGTLLGEGDTVDIIHMVGGG